MKRLISLYFIGFLFFGLVFLSSASAQGESFSFSYAKTELTEKYEWNFSYAAYYVHYTFVAALELDKMIPERELLALEKSIIKVLSRSYKAQVKVPDYDNGQDLWITVAPVRTPANPEDVHILLLTNYSFKNNRIVQEEEMGDAYAFFIKLTGKKWVKTSKLFSDEKESELIKKGGLNNLADFVTIQLKPGA